MDPKTETQLGECRCDEPPPEDDEAWEPRLRNCPRIYDGELPNSGFYFQLEYFWPDDPEDEESIEAGCLKQCPWGLLTDWTRHILELYGMFINQGVLPYAGGLYDQPAMIMDHILLVKAEFEKIRKEKKRVGDTSDG